MFQIKSSPIRTASVSWLAGLFWLLINISSLSVYMKYQIAIRKMQNEILTKMQDQVQQWGEYEVIMNFGSKQNSRNQVKQKRPIDITLVTQCSVNNLHYIVESLQRWDGPISVAVLGAKDHFLDAKFGAKSLSECYSSANISFHIVFPYKHKPTFSDKAVEIWANYYKIKNKTARCDHLLAVLHSITGLNYAFGEIAYPHNTLRNVAKRGVISTHMLLLDVDVMPSANIRKSFLEDVVLSSDKSQSVKNDKIVYITPVFEIEIDAKMPRMKSELKRAIKAEQARVFHMETCPICHKPTR